MVAGRAIATCRFAWRRERDEGRKEEQSPYGLMGDSGREASKAETLTRRMLWSRGRREDQWQKFPKDEGDETEACAVRARKEEV